MTTLSLVRQNVLRLLNSNIWFQRYGIQDPLLPEIVIDGVSYPPNVFVELPTSGSDVAPSSGKSFDNPQFECSASLSYKIVHIFHRTSFQTYKSLPYRQVEDLVNKTNIFLLTNYKALNSDISSLNVIRNGTNVDVRSADDINSTVAELKSWAIVSTFAYSVRFLTSLDEYTPANFNQLQPATWGLLEGEPINFVPFNLNEIRFVINQSELPNVRPDEPDTYRPYTTLIIKDSESEEG